MMHARTAFGILTTVFVALSWLTVACTDLPLSRCDFQPQALCVGTPGCVPDCSDRECGPDPECGFSCGSCGPYSLCDDDAGQCEACDHAALCAERECGEDGCGTLCGICGEGETCEDGACVAVCVPACKGRMCGDNGCGGACGSCPAGAVCTSDRLCQYPEGHFCAPSDTPGCPDCPEGVEECVCEESSPCCEESWSSHCVYLSWQWCGSGCEQESSCGGNTYENTATPYTVRPECGQDQYGRACGACAPEEHCHAGATCLPGAADAGLPCMVDDDCLNDRCLPPEGGGVCTLACTNGAHCPEGWACDVGLLPESWQGLCRPQEICFAACDGTSCGPDGCGGTCGVCPDGEACVPGGTCAASTADPCEVSWGVPGCAGCACEDVVCEIEPACCLEAWSPFCVFLCDSTSDAPCNIEICGPHGDPCDGCQPIDSLSCWDCQCQECVCDVYPHCCLQRWDDLCVMQCQLCGTKCPAE